MLARISSLLEMIEGAYFKPSGHIFIKGFHVVFTIVLFELLIRIFATREVVHYNATDIWFYLSWSYVPLGTLLFSVVLAAPYAKDMYFAIKGIKTPAEEAADKAAKKKIEDRLGFPAELRREPEKGGKIPIRVVPFAVPIADKKPYKPNWSVTMLVLVEGLIRGIFVLIISGLLTKLVVRLIVGTQFYVVPAPLDTLVSLSGYQTNIGQDLALALGSGVYEELLFRVMLFGVVAERLSKAVDLSITIPFFNKKIDIDNAAVTFVSACLYAATAHIFGDNYHFYPFVYRVILGIALTRVYQRRGIAVAIWTHIAHDLVFFMIR